MKNSFKLAFVALAFATTFSACGGNNEDEVDTTVIDSNITVDSVITVDSNVVDPLSTDTAGKM